MAIETFVLNRATGAPDTGVAYRRNYSGSSIISVSVEGSGSVSTTAEVYASQNGRDWQLLRTITASGTGKATTSFSSDQSWPFFKSDVTAISGTDAAAVVELSSSDVVAGDAGGGGALSLFDVFLEKKSRRILWWGDSTTEASTGNGVIPYAWARTGAIDMLSGHAEHKNYGANGYSTTAILSAAQGASNDGGNIITPEGVAAEVVLSKVDLIALCFGINDFRINTNVATYGSAEMVSAVLALQSRISDMVKRVRAVAGDVPILFHVPNTLAKTGPLLSVAGQSATDALRATYLGDDWIGVKPLTDIVSNSVVTDSGGVVFGLNSPDLSKLPDTTVDELHPSTKGYATRMTYISNYLQTAGEVEKFEVVSVGKVSASGSNYTDLQFNQQTSQSFGDVVGTTDYGKTYMPNVGVGDVLRFYTGTKVRDMVIKNSPYNSAGTFLRWANGKGIDGNFHETTLLTGMPFELLRRTKNAYTEFAKPSLKAYPFRVLSGGNGTLTIVGIPSQNSLASRTPLTTDFIALPSFGGENTVSVAGKALTGAAIAAVAGKAGQFTITLTGDFSSSVGQIGNILAP